MKTFVALALAATVLATPRPMPQSSSPAGCSGSKAGSFQLSVVNVTKSAKRDVERRQLSGILTITINGGVLKDQAGRTGNIVANHQFQFDNPLQNNALKTSGFSICSNGSLASGGSAIWYQCFSGSFYNLYDVSLGAHCNQIYIVATGSSTSPVTQISDGQPGASSAVPISQLTDGQPQAPTGVRVSQISDGQPQAPTGRPISQISDGQPQVPTGIKISQISDGQPQVPTGIKISQISDGQPQVPTGVKISQISDGQPQVPTAKPAPGPVISQISDGQPQVPTAKPAPGPVISQISDGQPQVPTAAPGPKISQISDGQPQVPTPKPTSARGPVISQISDGQPQVPVATASRNITVPSVTAPAPSLFTGAAATPLAGVGAFAAGLFALAAML